MPELKIIWEVENFGYTETDTLNDSPKTVYNITEKVFEPGQEAVQKICHITFNRGLLGLFDRIGIRLLFFNIFFYGALLYKFFVRLRNHHFAVVFDRNHGFDKNYEFVNEERRERKNNAKTSSKR